MADRFNYSASAVASQPTIAFAYIGDRYDTFKANGQDIFRTRDEVREAWQKARSIGDTRAVVQFERDMATLQSLWNKWSDANVKVEALRSRLESMGLAGYEELGYEELGAFPLVIPAGVTLVQIAAVILSAAIAMYTFRQLWSPTDNEIKERLQDFWDGVLARTESGDIPDVLPNLPGMPNDPDSNEGVLDDITKMFMVVGAIGAGMILLPMLRDAQK